MMELGDIVRIVLFSTYFLGRVIEVVINLPLFFLVLESVVVMEEGSDQRSGHLLAYEAVD
jgi:hypothetical protein